MTVNKWGFIDKLSVTFYASYSSHSRIKDYQKIVEIDKLLVGDVKTVVREKGRINSYKYMAWSNVNDEGVVVVKYGRFTKEGTVNYRYLNVEYNPNKASLPPVLLSFLKTFGFMVVELNSVDFSFDVYGRNVDEFLFVAPPQSSTMSFGTLGGTSSKYLHPKSNNGRVKVYDKYEERKTMQKKIPSIDAELYKECTRVEYTFHNLGYCLNPFYEEADYLKATECCKYLSQVMVRQYGEEMFSSDYSINKCDKFVIDSFMASNDVDSVRYYISLKGINNRKRLNDYVREVHYDFLWYNSLNDAERFMRNIKDEVYKCLPLYVLE